LGAPRGAAAPRDPLALQIAQFARVARGQEPPLVSGRDGLRALEIINAIHRAAASGERVEVGP
jgi:predicted dehydrogenase